MAAKKTKTKYPGAAELKLELSENRERQLYLLYGPENYLIQKYKNALLAHYAPDGNTLNLSTFSGEKIPVPELIDTIRTMPFLAPHRVVLVEGSGFFKKSADEFLEGLESIAETTVLIFVEPDKEKAAAKGGKSEEGSSVDRRGKLFKTFDRDGGAFYFVPPDNATLSEWIVMEFSKAGIRVERQVPDRLIAAVGNGMQRLSNEIAKLIAYTIDRGAVRIQDIEDLCVSQVEEQIFKLLDAIAMKEREKAVILYHDLLYLRESPWAVLALIQRHYQILLCLSQLAADGVPRNEYASRAGIPPFSVSNYEKQAKMYTLPQLLHFSDLCFEASTAIPRGILSDKDALDRLILQLLTE